MRKIRYLFFLGLIVIVFGCSKDESIRLSSFEIPIVTGFELRNIHGQSYGYYGIPNIKLSNESNDLESNYSFITIPNPCNKAHYNFCNIYIQSPNSNAIKNIWIVQAQFQDSNSEAMNYVGFNAINVGGAPLMEVESINSHLSLDLTGLTNGYYRVYLKIDSLLLYDNIVITSN